MIKPHKTDWLNWHWRKGQIYFSRYYNFGLKPRRTVYRSGTLFVYTWWRFGLHLERY